MAIRPIHFNSSSSLSLGLLVHFFFNLMVASVAVEQSLPLSKALQTDDGIRKDNISPSTVVRVGVILPFESDYQWSLARTKPSIEYALDYVRRNLLLTTKGVQVRVDYDDSGCSDVTGPLAGIRMYYNRSVDLFLGPVCDYAVAPLARYSPSWNIPVITGGAMVSELSNKDEYKLLTRISGSYAKLGQFVDLLFNKLNWTTVGVMVHDNLNERRHLGHSECFFAVESVFRKLKERFIKKFPKQTLWSKDFDERSSTSRAVDFDFILEQASHRTRSM